MSKNKLTGEMAEVAMKSLFESGVISKETTVSDLLKVASKLEREDLNATLLYDSDNWFALVP